MARLRTQGSGWSTYPAIPCSPPILLTGQCQWWPQQQGSGPELVSQVLGDEGLPTSTIPPPDPSKQKAQIVSTVVCGGQVRKSLLWTECALTPWLAGLAGAPRQKQRGWELRCSSLTSA